ncbi:unnamed protein product [Cylicostephanus goldi]|uniref:Uncharacterized protein n=1 Tax=Cylicostephanus goldi TaxID=71465 RepID=A0A3P6QPX0_CYLGO|nr:unnamed protein product [Cylicostephanus goldi]
MIILAEALPVVGMWKKYKPGTGKNYHLWKNEYEKPWKSENEILTEEDYNEWFQKTEQYFEDLANGKYRLWDQHLSVVFGDNGVIYYDDGVDYGDYYEAFDNELK